MASGYTYKIVEGEEVSFRDFVLHCSKVFVGRARFVEEGDPLTPVMVDSYYLERVVKTKAEVEKWDSMTIEKVADICEEYYKEEVARYNDTTVKRDAACVRVEVMLAKVRAWEPPSPDHEALKQFMVDQLKATLRFERYAVDQPKKVSPEEYLKMQRQIAAESFAQATSSYEEQVKGVNDINGWLLALGKAIEQEPKLPMLGF